MNKVFKIENPLAVGDGTLVSPFLNAKDASSTLPFDLNLGFGLSAGEIKAGKISKIHILPYVTQVTFVWLGAVEIRMMDAGGNKPYRLTLSAGDAALTEPGTFLQFVNFRSSSCHVLYMTSPSYLSDEIFDDSIILDRDWEQPERLKRKFRERVQDQASPEARQAAEVRFRQKKENSRL